MEPESYEARRLEDRVDIVRRDVTITTRLTVLVSPDDDAEVRRVTVVNEGDEARDIQLTSYAEIVLTPAASDTAHRAFSNLFVRTEFAADIGAVLATRRRRSTDEPSVWAAHLAVVEGDEVSPAQFETARARFLGRGRDIRTSDAVLNGPIVGEGQSTQAPWINVIANPASGFQTSVEGSGFTWAINSQQHQLSPWSNDVVSDRPGEVLYVRDEDDGAVWTPTALPIREDAGSYVVSHGQGFADLGGRQQSWTGDRREFLGRNGTLEYPAALATGTPLTTRVGGGLDPCGALQTAVDLEPDGSTEITRAHLLRAAARQFVEGDVQHWWLPPLRQGVRTRITDDRLWRPYAVAEYIDVTGDVVRVDDGLVLLVTPPFAMLGDGEKAGELFSLLNPIHHAITPADMHRYKVEPYVVCADVYAEPSHVGRGGCTWYTGSGAWMYRTGFEWILGFRLRGAALIVDPCVTTSWPGFTIAFRYLSAHYDITLENPNGVSHGVSRISLDGKALQTSDGRIPLADDGAHHGVEVVLG